LSKAAHKSRNFLTRIIDHLFTCDFNTLMNFIPCNAWGRTDVQIMIFKTTLSREEICSSRLGAVSENIDTTLENDCISLGYLGFINFFYLLFSVFLYFSLYHLPSFLNLYCHIPRKPLYQWFVDKTVRKILMECRTFSAIHWCRNHLREEYDRWDTSWNTSRNK
jgi:hypothetical protein